MNAFESIHNELKRLGYVNNLMQENYVFDDAAFYGKREMTIPLAAFAQWPPSYRNACIGVLIANGQSGPRHVSMYRTLGAPMFFEAFPEHVDRYRIEATGEAVFLESIPSRNIPQAFKKNKKIWNPEAIFRAKAIAPLKATPYQLDFMDIGLLPALKGMIHRKLDRLLRDTLHEAIITYEKALGVKPDETSLFRLVFRFLAAKIFNDRNHPGDWSASEAKVIIDRVQKFYGPFKAGTQKIIEEPETQKIVWGRLRDALNFQNLSVEDLAFIYENTLIRKATRQQYGIHSTPSIIADLMVDRLPFESLASEDRYVLEPCAGHGVFLVASLRRLRELLPASWSDQKRHSYLKDRLTAIELDSFAAEVCRLSLMLADYPNPDGWQIISEDIFGGNTLESRLRKSRVVLCNPPFEDFTLAERNSYGDNVQNAHKPYEVLRRILEHPPEMLGFVLPKSAIMGERYSDLQDRIARNYKNIETIALPDRIFAHSDQETMIVLASERDESLNVNISAKTFWVRENKRRSFLETGRLPEAVRRVHSRPAYTSPPPLWNPQLWEIWDYLKDYPCFDDIVEIHQGIQWNIPLEKNRSILISSDPKRGFKKGLDKVPGRIEPYYTKHFTYLNMSKEYRRRKAHLFPWDHPKVIANRAVISRGPWRIMGFTDHTGLVCRENFIGIWPQKDINIEVVSSLINSPMVNAALYVREGKRLNRNSTLKHIPIPFPDTIDTKRISVLVKQYTRLRSGFEKHPSAKKNIDQCITILKEIDSLILKAYDLPPRLERKLLELFRGYPRPVPFDFPDYYPEDFGPNIPLHKYLKTDLEQAVAGKLLKKITPFDSKDMHEFFMDLEARQS